MDRVLEKIFRVGSGTDWVRVLVSNIESIGYYRVLKILNGYLLAFSYFPHIFLWNINYVNQMCLWWTDLDLHAFGSKRSSLRNAAGLVSHFLKFSLGLVQVCIHPKSGHPGRPDSAKELIFRKKDGRRTRQISRLHCFQSL